MPRTFHLQSDQTITVENTDRRRAAFVDLERIGETDGRRFHLDAGEKKAITLTPGRPVRLTASDCVDVQSALEWV